MSEIIELFLKKQVGLQSFFSIFTIRLNDSSLIPTYNHEIY